MTIKEIAIKAGVSIGTVDRVLHNRGRVSPDTIKKIDQIIKESGYKPNIFASNLSSSKTYTFGILMPIHSQDSGYWAIPELGIKSALKELTMYNVKLKFFFFNKYIIQSFEKACENILKTNLDGILIAPVLTEQTGTFIKDNLSKKIPCVIFDSDLPEIDYLSFIGQNSYQSGILAGRLMSIISKEKGTITIVRVIPDDYHIRRRAEGFIGFLKSYENIKCSLYDIEESDNPKIFEYLTEKIVNENKDLSGIFVTNDSIHYIAKAVKSLNNKLNRKINLIGYDLMDKNIAYLKEGIIDFLISQQPYSQGYKGIYTLFRAIVLKEKVKKRIMMPIDIITKENIDYYYQYNS